MKRTHFLLSTMIIGLVMCFQASCSSKEEDPVSLPDMLYSIPTEGNSWFFRNPDSPNQQVSNIGAQAWTDPEVVLRTYFWVERTGDLHIGLRAKVDSGQSVIAASFIDEEIELDLTGVGYEDMFIGTFTVDFPGYHYLDIRGISRESLNFANISHVLLGGTATASGVHYINEEYFYWGRRGPSVHLSYEKPQGATDIRWFYNEVSIPDGSDVIGSFFMANGFGQGYFGMQVNNENERRVLFSVWSPYVTDNPAEIPEEYRVILLDKGEGVIAQDFGHEGSGGQSYMIYDWQPESTYRFLLRGEPTGNGETDFTAFFYSPENGEWQLIASWRRPFTDTFLTNSHSFLENFDTRTGPLPRKGYFNNQWIFDTAGNWHEMTRARFTADATARSKARLDYAGGNYSADKGFFMKNCGFFSDNTEIDTWHTRLPSGEQPDVDFSSLPGKTN